MTNIKKQILFKTSMLQSDLCNYSDKDIIVQGIIITEGGNNGDIKNGSLALKNNAPFIDCISQINNVLINNAGNLDVLMPMYSLIECSKY